MPLLTKTVFILVRSQLINLSSHLWNCVCVFDVDGVRMSNCILLSDDALDIREARSKVMSPTAGAVSIFIGSLLHTSCRILSYFNLILRGLPVGGFCRLCTSSVCPYGHWCRCCKLETTKTVPYWMCNWWIPKAKVKRSRSQLSSQANCCVGCTNTSTYLLYTQCAKSIHTYLELHSSFVRISRQSALNIEPLPKRPSVC